MSSTRLMADEDEGQRRGGRDVEADLVLGEDLGGERAEAEHGEGPVVREQVERHQQAAAEDGRAGLAEGDPAEGAPRTAAEALGALLLQRVHPSQAGRHQQVHQRVAGQGLHQHRPAEAPHDRADRDPPVADDELGDGEGQDEQQGPDPASGQRRSLDQPGRRRADHRTQGGDGGGETEGVAEEGGHDRPVEQTDGRRPPGVVGLDADEDQRGQDHDADQAADQEQPHRRPVAAVGAHPPARRSGGDGHG